MLYIGYLLYNVVYATSESYFRHFLCQQLCTTGKFRLVSRDRLKSVQRSIKKCPEIHDTINQRRESALYKYHTNNVVGDAYEPNEFYLCTHKFIVQDLKSELPGYTLHHNTLKQLYLSYVCPQLVWDHHRSLISPRALKIVHRICLRILLYGIVQL